MVGLDVGLGTDAPEFVPAGPLSGGETPGTSEVVIPGLSPPGPVGEFAALDKLGFPFPPPGGFGTPGLIVLLGVVGVVGVILVELEELCFPGAVRLAPLELDCVVDTTGMVGVATPGRETVP